MKYLKSIFTIGLTCSILLTWSQFSSAHEVFPSASHSGGTDKCGCHTSSKTGEYHCHKRKKRGGSCPSVVENVEDKNTEEKELNIDVIKPA